MVALPGPTRAALITQNGYGGHISSCCSNPPLAGGAPGCQLPLANTLLTCRPPRSTLPSYLAGQNIKSGFRTGSDSSVSAPGWNVDDIQITSSA